MVGLEDADSLGVFMTDINYEIKQYRGEGKFVSCNTRGNDSNPHWDVHHHRVAVASSATLEVNSSVSAEQAPDTYMTIPENCTVAFSSKSSLDMVVRGLEDLEALFEMRLNEAKSAGETISADAAATELQVVMEALAALYSASTLSPR